MLFAARWRAAVNNLRLGADLVRETANDLPLEVMQTSDAERRPSPARLLRRHLVAHSDYTTALACVQALLREHDADAQ